MKVLVTGGAGFIGNALALRLFERGDEVIGVDNVNAYYDPVLKENRVNRARDFAGVIEKLGSLESRRARSGRFRESNSERVAPFTVQTQAANIVVRKEVCEQL